MRALAIIIAVVGVLGVIVLGAELGIPMAVSLAVTILIFAAILFEFGTLIDSAKKQKPAIVQS